MASLVSFDTSTGLVTVPLAFNLTCIAHGRPAPQISLYKDGLEVLPNDQSGNYLNIVGV